MPQPTRFCAKEKSMIKVMLADDQKILAEGIKSVLETCPDIQVCGMAYDGLQAVEMAKKLAK